MYFFAGILYNRIAVEYNKKGELNSMMKVISAISALALTAAMLITNAFAAGGNLVTDQSAWQKMPGISCGTITKKTENGQDYWSAEGINNPWESPGFDILPVLKKAMGDEDYVTVNISFEIRATFKNAGDADDFNVGVLIRAFLKSGYTVDDFKADYEGGFIKNTSDVNLAGRFVNEELISGEWTKVSYSIEDLATEAVNFENFASWMLCVDRISSDMTGKIKTLDFKNVSVTVDSGEEEKKPDENTGNNTGDTKPYAVVNTPIPTAKAGKPTPTPAAINTPVNFNKYPQTLVDGTVPEAGRVTPAPGENAKPADNGGAATDNTKTNNTILYIVIGIVAVAVTGAAVAFIVIKKKKSTDGEAE